MIKLELAGRITRDPQVFTTKTGGQIVSFSVAVSVVVMKESQPVFIDCKAFSPLDEVAAELRKGDAVYLQAEPRTESWDKDGKSHSKTVWVPFLLVPYAKDTGGAVSQTQRAPAQAKAAPAEAPSVPEGEDDVPFAIAWWLGLFIPVAAHASLIT